MMRLRNLSYMTLWAVKFDEEKNLYKEILGLPVTEENANFIMFGTKGSRLAFHLLKKGSRLDRQTVELHFEVDDVDEVYSALQRRNLCKSSLTSLCLRPSTWIWFPLVETRPLRLLTCSLRKSTAGPTFPGSLARFTVCCCFFSLPIGFEPFFGLKLIASPISRQVPL